MIYRVRPAAAATAAAAVDATADSQPEDDQILWHTIEETPNTLKIIYVICGQRPQNLPP